LTSSLQYPLNTGKFWFPNWKPNQFEQLVGYETFLNTISTILMRSTPLFFRLLLSLLCVSLTDVLTLIWLETYVCTALEDLIQTLNILLNPTLVMSQPLCVPSEPGYLL
jgi:hypothetical protein